MNDLKSIETGVLYAYRDNAAATEVGAIGHTKAAMNNALFVAYTDELKSRGVMVGKKYDDLLKAAKNGTMNGPGAA